MRVSVVIPNYNYAKFLPLAINSLLGQSVKPDEIIVVDDGSTDNSLEVLNGFGDAITVIAQENGGQAAAISRGFAASTGDIVCILDSDDMFFPDKVKILKEIYTENPRAGWVFHDLEHVSADNAASVLQYNPITKTEMKIVDERAAMRRGHPRYDAPATSGLTFRRDFIAPLFPLPAAKSIYISDHYIKFYAKAVGPGIHVTQALGAQIIHGSNLYTGTQPDATKAKIFSNTAFFLYKKLPEVKKFCTNLMAEALVCAKAAGISPQVEEIAGQYLKLLSPAELLFLKLKVSLKTILRKIL